MEKEVLRPTREYFRLLLRSSDGCWVIKAGASARLVCGWIMDMDDEKTDANNGEERHVYCTRREMKKRTTEIETYQRTDNEHRYERG